MKLTLTTGCMSHDITVDDKPIIDICDINELKNLAKKSVESIPDKYFSKTEELIWIMSDVICFCKSSSNNEFKYDSGADDVFSITLLKTKSFRIRQIYDGSSQQEWMLINDNVSTEIPFENLKKILVEILDEYFENPTHQDIKSISITINHIISNVVSEFGVLVSVSDPCECCGDNIYKFLLEI